jgi:hypothetical protein
MSGLEKKVQLQTGGKNQLWSPSNFATIHNFTFFLFIEFCPLSDAKSNCNAGPTGIAGNEKSSNLSRDYRKISPQGVWERLSDSTAA